MSPSNTLTTRGPAVATVAQASPALTLVIPARDEATRLPRTLDRISTWATFHGLDIEVIVVDDGSLDGTPTVAAAFRRRLPHLTVLRHDQPRGKGAAIRTGFAAARGDVVAFSDADLSAPIEQLPALLAALVAGADIAIGSRRGFAAPRPRHRSLMRAVASVSFAWIARRLVKTHVRDTQCGFKAFRAGMARQIVNLARIDGFAFDVEWIALARRLGASITECPVPWTADTASRVRLASASASMLRDVFRLRRRLRADRRDDVAASAAAV